MLVCCMKCWWNFTRLHGITSQNIRPHVTALRLSNPTFFLFCYSLINSLPLQYDRIDMRCLVFSTFIGFKICEYYRLGSGTGPWRKAESLLSVDPPIGRSHLRSGGIKRNDIRVVGTGKMHYVWVSNNALGSVDSASGYVIEINPTKNKTVRAFTKFFLMLLHMNSSRRWINSCLLNLSYFDHLFWRIDRTFAAFCTVGFILVHFAETVL
jgi:hypothetical protein